MPPPPPAPVLAAPVVIDRGARALDDQLVTVYKNSSTVWVTNPAGQRVTETTMLKPINSIDPVKGALMRGGAGSGGLPPVAAKMLERLATVIAQAHFGNGSTKPDLFRDIMVGGNVIAGIMTIRQFMGLSSANQLATIDQAWNKVCKKKAYNQLSREMFEPAGVVVAATKDPVPSGAVPGAGLGMTVGYTNDARVPDAFTGLGVGFRVDGSGDCQRGIDRVTREGMTTQLKNRHLMYTIKGWEVEGTVVDTDTSAPRVWSTKNDLFNESAVCVSRNLYGATAFPMRETVDEAVLWAVDIGGLAGFDTETYQTGLERQWRPGEKAYKRVPLSNIIGYLRFNKLGTGDQGGWSFRIDAGAAWTLVGSWAAVPATSATSREARIRKYINDQLDAWKGPARTISGDYDFSA